MSDVTTDSQVWFITGAGRGLGRALAEHVLAQGGCVIATARTPGALDDLVAQAGDRLHVLALDLADRAAIAAVVEHGAAVFGRLDVVVNNAGRGLIGALEEIDDTELARNFEVNCFGALRVWRAALPILRAQRRGHLVAISAAAAIANYPGFSIYGAAKAALESAAEALAAEVRGLGIRVTLVEPGPFRTGFVGQSLERAALSLADYDVTSGKFRRLIESTAGKQPGDPARAAEAIVAAVRAENPPLRLVLGKYATDKARRTLAARLRELEAWEAVGTATEFGPGQPAAR